MGASTRRRALAEKSRCLPERPNTGDCFASKVVRADEQRIIVERLRARRLVVGIVQPHESVSEEGGKLTARFFNLGAWSRRRLQDSLQVASHLHFGMMVVINSRGPLRSLAVCEDRTRHLELARLTGQMNHVLLWLLALLLLLEGIPQGEEGVKRDQTLVVQYGTDSAGEFPVHPQSFRAGLSRSCQQLDDSILRTGSLAGRRMV